jgi:hypothetical protein
MKIRYLVVVGMLGMLVQLGSATKVLAHGGNATLVHACISNLLKTVRIVGPNDNCLAKLETAMHWSIAGPTGPQGPQGIQGPPGPGGNGSGSGLVVIDNQGNVVGPLLDQDFVVITVGNRRFIVNPFRDFLQFGNGLQFPSTQGENISFYHRGPNCGGPRHIQLNSGLNSLLIIPFGYGGNFVFTEDAQQNFCSPQRIASTPSECPDSPAGGDSVELVAENLSQPGQCQNLVDFGEFVTTAGTAVVVPVPVAYVPPFSLQ